MRAIHGENRVLPRAGGADIRGDVRRFAVPRRAVRVLVGDQGGLPHREVAHRPNIDPTEITFAARDRAQQEANHGHRNQRRNGCVQADANVHHEGAAGDALLFQPLFLLPYRWGRDHLTSRVCGVGASVWIVRRRLLHRLRHCRFVCELGREFRLRRFVVGFHAVSHRSLAEGGWAFLLLGLVSFFSPSGCCSPGRSEVGCVLGVNG